MNEVVHLHHGNGASTEETSPEGPPSIRAVAVLFLSYGRNAWHSTWVRSYQPGSFFRDGRVVQSVVERRKERGTVFYMKVLPAFQIGYGDRKFLLTEINTPQPFRNIDLDNVRFGLMAADLKGFLEQITPPSRLWKPVQSRKNAIIVQEVSEDFIDLASYNMLARGRDRENNPPIGNYRREVIGTFSGFNHWEWWPSETGNRISLRWYNRALEAFMEGSERMAEHRGIRRQAPDKPMPVQS
jgi:hypothetical protein